MSFSPGLEGSWVLNNATGFRKIYIAAGYTDLRRGIDGLASIIKFNFQLDPYEKDILFLFCGRRSDRIKGLVWEGDGFLLLLKKNYYSRRFLQYPIYKGFFENLIE